MTDRVRVPVLADLPLPAVPPVVDQLSYRRSYRRRYDRRSLERACARCGIPIAQHATCSACGALAGESHPVAPYLVGGRCPTCAERAR